MRWPELQRDHPLHVPYKWARRIVITLTGFTVLLVGFAMIVLPGPAFVVIPAGLAILGLEFAWARHTLRALRKRGAIIVAAAKAKLR
ncbi:MAG TPA: PGPGW domain-containing protein [Steroidobacteraceae bacterium]|nr:PGPGW domain-containing protein [Steroidobacteraceae bacterium]HQW09528.1 PGPGW domain-containing protein [Steroidobacteraceae bacterium]HQX47272.1 PGPGW domain-containing protein [Steroidobacteraceae bacterium]HQX77269.1 PGPGW domain-containing protein [Steroidobacteraceae bacterium]HQZ79519.1 PGPGW domain-containing protein [Steroidobacteraceae bacterium]